MSTTRRILQCDAANPIDQTRRDAHALRATSVCGAKRARAGHARCLVAAPGSGLPRPVFALRESEAPVFVPLRQSSTRRLTSGEGRHGWTPQQATHDR
jgi:hypothetical protein